MCVCLLSARLPAWLNQCSLQKVCWGCCLCQPASQSKHAICRQPHPTPVDRPITGRSSQEGPATWVILSGRLGNRHHLGLEVRRWNGLFFFVTCLRRWEMEKKRTAHLRNRSSQTKRAAGQKLSFQRGKTHVTDFKNSTRWLVRQVKRPEGLDIHLKLCLQTPLILFPPSILWTHLVYSHVSTTFWCLFELHSCAAKTSHINGSICG